MGQGLRQMSQILLFFLVHYKAKISAMELQRPPEKLLHLKRKRKADGELESLEEQNERLNRQMLKQRAYREKLRQQDRDTKRQRKASPSQVSAAEPNGLPQLCIRCRLLPAMPDGKKFLHHRPS